MYRLLLCWRYLLTRYLALACIISVMLGVATLIVVNSVMGGFSTKLKQRLHGLLSDVLVESMFQDGFADPEGKMAQIRNSPIGDKIEAMTPSIEVLGLIQITYHGEKLAPRAVHLMGVNAQGRSRIGGFAEYMTDPRLKANPSFDLSPEAKKYHEEHYVELPDLPLPVRQPLPGDKPNPIPLEVEPRLPSACIPGYSLGHYREKATPEHALRDVPMLEPGDEVVITTLSGQKFSPVYDRLIVAGFFKSEMSEYDSNYVFVPLEWMQVQRTMQNRATSIQIKLKDYADAAEVVATLQAMFPHEVGYHVETWEEKQGALLAAISIEKSILNILLFLIIGVAGFGILAIFAMIVVEKTRDIGILKALGASNMGVMNIFLGYGLLLGIVGAGLGTALGLAITTNLNPIEKLLTRITGQEIFDRSVYYFNEIPTDIQTWTVAMVNVGAVLIAVIFSVLPSLRAAMLHPVRALRYE